MPAQETTPPPKPIEVPEDPGSRPLAEMSLEELSQLPVTVASKSAQPLHKSSGIVTLITREEIQNSGARDLIDVLRMVPGFEFGLDVRGVTSIGIRGNWAHEGKVLILWDGQSLNESLYSTIQLGNHYPVDLIERIEIVRGPGSAVYGGMAELGVINIVSRASREAKTALATASFGWMA
ncbi:MAG TPA: TonB-dependent receptor plug domain-containing protein, partial [Candidatus Aminicenantes bacterium]|nr:TonB-dependent receptor plug domain-containing protein [Candidatus Aminicenantes bacterium]